MIQNSPAPASNEPSIETPNLIEASNLIAPKIELIGEGTIIITGNTPGDLVPHIDNILDIVHSIRHFSQDGDRSGHRAIAEKKAAGIPLENGEFRLRISYTNSRTVRDDGSFEINFLISAAGKHELFPESDSSDKQPPTRAMDSDEIKKYFAKVISMCFSELCNYLKRAFSSTTNDELSPDSALQ